MTSQELLGRRRKPRFYENHADVLANTLLEDHVLSLYLYENMLNHFQDIDDVSNSLDVYSELDGELAKVEN